MPIPRAPTIATPRRLRGLPSWPMWNKRRKTTKPPPAFKVRIDLEIWKSSRSHWIQTDFIHPHPQHPQVLQRHVVRPDRGSTGKEVCREERQQRGQTYPLSCLDRVVCPYEYINMLFFFEHTLEPEALRAALRRVVTKHPFLAGTFRGWLKGARVVCDDAGVEFTVAESTWTLEDIEYDAPALARPSPSAPCGFGSGTLWDRVQSRRSGVKPDSKLTSRIRTMHRQAPRSVEGHLKQSSRRAHPPDPARRRRLLPLRQCGTFDPKRTAYTKVNVLDGSPT